MIAPREYCIVAAAVCGMACACAVISAVIARGQQAYVAGRWFISV